MDHRILQVMDYVFVIGMGAEIWLRVLAEGLLFTPKAVVKDTAGILDISMFIVSLIWVCWMPKVVAPHSLAQILMLLRCFRPLRQELLNIWTIDMKPKGGLNAESFSLWLMSPKNDYHRSKISTV